MTREFQEELYQEVLRASSAEGAFMEDAFFDLFAGAAIDSGEVSTAHRAYYRARGLAVDGYAGTPDENDGVLTLFVCDFAQEPAPASLTSTELEGHFRRVQSFIEKAMEPSFRRGLEETSAAFGLSDTIAETWTSIDRVRLVLFSNRTLSRRIDGIPAGTVLGKATSHSVWDASRLERFTASGREREELIVDLNEHGGPVQALPAHLRNADYEAYLLAIPGRQLASIYDRWGTRLLEQNVRVFLQAKGGVNRGIKNTLDAFPEMFFAYNNGVTATAESVETSENGGAVHVVSLKNLQIVNGGQTTASVYAASKRPGVKLDRVFVQMKLSIIPGEKAKEVVPRISEYANSQNKVNAADFFANHPFHLRIKQFSQTVYAPAADGTVKQTKWFYERARGEYQDARGGLTAAQRARFDLEYPRHQIFTKTDLAKFLAVWDGLPHIVSKGAQTNFVDFAGRIGSDWDVLPDKYNEKFYRECIAKAIIFREMERVVSQQSWYEGAYRANIVAYGIAKIGEDVRQLGKTIDFEAVWKSQSVGATLRGALSSAALAAFEVITSPPAGAVKNITEWAKRPGAWTNLKGYDIDYSRAFMASLLSTSEVRQLERDARKGQRLNNSVQAQIAVTAAGAAYWQAAVDWAIRNKLLSKRELDILQLAAKGKAVLSEKQCEIAVEAVASLIAAGYPAKHPIEFLTDGPFNE